MLLDIAAAIEERVEELGRLIATETGNALRTQARPEAGLAADIFRYFGGLAGEIKGECLPWERTCSAIPGVSHSEWWGRSFPGTRRWVSAR